jgi:ubiquinone/menaquinone biosynthesis C-methylase UbiE
MVNKKKIKNRLDSRYFGIEAKEYDYSRVEDIRDRELFKKEAEIIKRFLKKCKKGAVLDVACGTGRLFPYYGKRIIYGIDISKDMLKIAKKRGKKAKLKVADAENIPYSSNKFPVVITSRFICHTPYYEKAIKEMARVTRPGGCILIDFPNKHSLTYFTTKIRLALRKLKYYNLFTYPQIKKLAEKNNLEIKDIKTKAFFPTKIFPKKFHKLSKKLNEKLAQLFPYLSNPLHVRFEKKEI